jgi:1,4-alpha-glucan branching enzyme
VLVICNLTPVVRENYRLGVPRGGHWQECLNSDAPLYGGSGQGNFGGVDAAPLPAGAFIRSPSAAASGGVFPETREELATEPQRTLR